MKTIVIESQKGGSGKTMLAAHLAVEVERNGEAAWVSGSYSHQCLRGTNSTTCAL
jgi:Mrp family chromosome partitioning ATPase